jgi:anthranilate synthase/aminodeoxychorismate synthase-like glutamine amidotransferase
LGSRRLDERAWEALGAEKARRKIEGVMVFVLDNYDSFTYNLVQYMGELGAEVVVRRNDEVTPEEVVAMRPDRILLSPGPCTPQDAGILIPLIQHLAKLPQKEQIPVLGVCLGHQAMGAAFGGDVIRAPQLMHGKTSVVEHDGRTIFKGIPKPMTCTRYHSLIVDEGTLPKVLEISARVATAKGEAKGLIMALRHKTLPMEGVQFHPESVLTDHGKQLIANFLKQ